MRIPSLLQRFDTANLRLRAMSAVIMAPAALLVVYWGGLVYGAMVTCAMTVGLYEWLRLVAPQARPKIVGAACAMLIATLTAGGLFSLALGALLGVVSTLALYLLSARNRDENGAWMALGIPYMAGSGLAFLALRAPQDSGAGMVFYLLATVWALDIGAFFAGRLIGGPKLAPVISPGKTWAGLGGGMALAAVLGYAVAVGLGARHPAVAAVLSPVLAVIAQAGDLFESYVKRRAGVKESGDLIPGHGGILDRIDGLVFAGVFAFLFQAAIGEQIDWW